MLGKYLEFSYFIYLYVGVNMSNEIYQDFILELYKNPINFGKIENADLTATSLNPLCGDKVEIFIKLSNEDNKKEKKVVDAKFVGSGCAISQASACLLTEEIKGKGIEEIIKMNKDDVIRIIKIDLSKNPSRLKCAMLGLDSMKKAVDAKK